MVWINYVCKVEEDKKGWLYLKKLQTTSKLEFTAIDRDFNGLIFTDNINFEEMPPYKFSQIWTNRIDNGYYGFAL